MSKRGTEQSVWRAGGRCESYTNPDTGGIDSHLDVTPNSVPFGVHTGVILGALAATYLKPRDGSST